MLGQTGLPAEGDTQAVPLDVAVYVKHTFGRLSPYLHIMAALKTMAIGLALSWPAISGAEP